MKATVRLGGFRISCAIERDRSTALCTEGTVYELCPAGWSEAQRRATGYHSREIFDRALDAARQVRDGQVAYERDTVTFRQRAVGYPLFAWLMYVLSREGGVRVLDFGGGFASAYYQHRFLLDHVRGVEWGVVEQEHFVEAGRAEFESGSLRFFSNIAECVEAISPNFVLLGSVVQYMQEPYKLLEEVLSAPAKHVLVDRTMAWFGRRDEVAVQHVDPNIYPASYPVWMLDGDHMEAVYDLHGYEVIDKYNPCPGSLFGPKDGPSPYQSWFLAKK